MWTRTTFLPALTAGMTTSMTSSRFMYALSYTTASFFLPSRTAGFTRDPANMITSAWSISLFPLIVMSSGSPGPAPMKCTISIQFTFFLIRTVVK